MSFGAHDHIPTLLIVGPSLLLNPRNVIPLGCDVVPLGVAASHFAGKYELTLGRTVAGGHGSMAVVVGAISTALRGPYLQLCGGHIYSFVGAISTALRGPYLQLCGGHIYSFEGAISTALWGPYIQL